VHPSDEQGLLRGDHGEGPRSSRRVPWWNAMGSCRQEGLGMRLVLDGVLVVDDWAGVGAGE
jgi:hypothetical protein